MSRLSRLQSVSIAAIPRRHPLPRNGLSALSGIPRDRRDLIKHDVAVDLGDIDGGGLSRGMTYEVNAGPAAEEPANQSQRRMVRGFLSFRVGVLCCSARDRCVVSKHAFVCGP